MHYLYIIYYEKPNKYYTGESPDPECRLEQHNTDQCQKLWDFEIKLETKANIIP